MNIKLCICLRRRLLFLVTCHRHDARHPSSKYKCKHSAYSVLGFALKNFSQVGIYYLMTERKK